LTDKEKDETITDMQRKEIEQTKKFVSTKLETLKTFIQKKIFLPPNKVIYEDQDGHETFNVLLQQPPHQKVNIIGLNAEKNQLSCLIKGISHSYACRMLTRTLSHMLTCMLTRTLNRTLTHFYNCLTSSQRS
jgi:hypothetical protein